MKNKLINQFSLKPTTIGAQVIDDLANTNQYFYILKYIE